ncbi:MAG: glycosyl hydrolase family 3 [Treponema sp.]|nr:MAG: glycosyl hydrolase family 3 [Treponema sp.]
MKLQKPKFWVKVFVVVFIFATFGFLTVADEADTYNSKLHSQNTLNSKLPHFFDNEPNDVLAEKIADSMSEEELLAQVFMFGWAGQNPGDLLIDWVKTGLGSIKIFGWNTGNTKKLASSIYLLQSRALKTRFGIPLFVATDQEGGLVRHVKGLTTETPGNLAIGASGVPMDAYYSGYYISKELSAIGINLNFAPTVDLYTNHNSSVIGPRSFGDTPEIAATLGEAFVRGSRVAGVLTTAKHFPGHGDTSFDSHGRLPLIDISKETFYHRELIPFKRLIDAGVPVVMAGHLDFPCLEAGGKPATFSKKIMGDLLRKELGFKGLIITDDIMMYGAINYAGNVTRAVTLAIEAGNDIIESSTTPRKYQSFWTENLRKMKTDTNFRARVKDSALRILKIKLDYFKNSNHVQILPDIENIQKHVPAKDGYPFFQSLAARAVTVFEKSQLPYKPSETESIILASEYENFLLIGKRRFPKAQTTSLIDAIYARCRYADTVIFCISNQNSLEVFQNLQRQYPEKKYIIISGLSPVYLKTVRNVEAALAVYSYSDFSFIAGFAALCGDYEATGTFPLSGIE